MPLNADQVRQVRRVRKRDRDALRTTRHYRNVAYAYGLQRMTGTKTDGEEVELFFRATACFRRDNGRWRITHMHNSVPFAMDGSDKALLHLKP